MPDPITSWAKFLTACAEAYKTYLSTRQEAYNRKRDKQQEKAINLGEQGFSAMNEVFRFLHSECKPSLNESKWKEYYKLKEKVMRLHQKFNKYD